LGVIIPNWSIRIQYMNGSADSHPFSRFGAALHFAQTGISYSSNSSVRRVELHDNSGGARALWDESWDAISKAAWLGI
jgi:hypothetical protein